MSTIGSLGGGAGRRLRRAAFPVALAAHRARGRPERPLLTGAGIALAAALLGGLLGTSLAAQDSALARSVGAVPARDRSVRVVWGGTPVQDHVPFAALDHRARATLAGVTAARPFAVAIFRETTLGGAVVDLAAGDDLTPWLRLRSGRLPRACTAARCEVVQLGGANRLPHPSGLRIVRVGRGLLTSALPFGGLVAPDRAGVAAGARESGEPPFLLARGIAGLARAAPLRFDYRAYSWIVPLAALDIHPWTVDPLLARISRARATLTAGAAVYEVTAPDQELAAGLGRARTGGRRLLVLGGLAIALVLAFAVLAAARSRRDVRAARRRLVWAGAGRGQVLGLVATDAAAAALGGAAVGWLAGSAVAALAARHFGTAVGGVVAHSVLSRTGVAAAALLALVAAVVVAVALTARPVRAGGLSFSVPDALALGALAVIAVGLARGDIGTTASGGGTTLLLVLPGLVALIACVATVRVLEPALRLLERLARRGSVSLRLAVLSLARAPGQAALAAAFVAVSIGLALFAAVYRSTLTAGQREEAAYAVPADVVLRESLSRLVPVTDAAPATAYRRLGDARPVVRLSVDVPLALAGQPVTLLGLPASSVRRIGGWRADFSSSSPAELGKAIGPAHPVGLRGAYVPRGSTKLVLPVGARGGSPALRAVFESARGEFVSARLRRSGGRLAAALPPRAAGGKLVALAAVPPATGLHDSGNAIRLGALARGVVRLGRPFVETRSGRRPLVVDWGDWIGSGGMNVLRGGRVSYVLTADRDALVRAREPTDGRPVPVVASRDVAASAGSGGVLTLDFAGQPVEVRVAATASRFPSAPGSFVVADLGTLTTAMNAAVPGSATTNEVWVDARAGTSAAGLEAAARRPPFDRLAAVPRARLERQLRGDPLARGALLALEAAAALAAALGLVGLLLSVLADVRDERAEMRELEALGASPRALRRHVRLRAAVVAGLGALAGGVVAAALGVLVVRFVSVTANAGSPEPPLVTHVDVGTVAGVLAAFALLAAAVVVVPTARPPRGRT